MALHLVTRRSLLVLIAITAGTMELAVAQFTPITPFPGPINLNPPKPRIDAPSGVQQVNQAQTTTVVFRWYQPVASLTSSREAAYLVVCLQAAAQSCVYGGSGVGVWSGPAAGSMFSRTPVQSGSPFTTGPRLLLGYNYSMTVVLDQSYYNQWLQVKVGGCASQSNASCTFANPVNAAFSSVDLIAENTGSFSNSTTQEHFYGEARNVGSGNSGMFRAVLNVSQIEITRLGDGFPWMCQTDPNAAGLNLADSDTLINWNGARYSVGSRRDPVTGVIDVAGLAVIGIHRTTHAEHVKGGSLVAVMANTTLGVVSTNIDVVRPMGFVATLDVDDPSIVPEYDETNNRRADCSVIQ